MKERPAGTAERSALDWVKQEDGFFTAGRQVPSETASFKEHTTISRRRYDLVEVFKKLKELLHK